MMMKRIQWILGVLLLCAGGALCAGEPRPNVIVILTDDQGWGDLGVQGHPYIQSPHIDQLAHDGLRFTQGYAGAAVCSPSRAALLTGRTPFRNGVYRWLPLDHECHLRASEITLPQLLRQSGYQTAHFGKWHLSAYDEDRRWGGITTDKRYEEVIQAGPPMAPFSFGRAGEPSMNDYGYDYWLATGNVARPSHKNPRNLFLNGEPLGLVKGFAAQIVADHFDRWMNDVCKKDQPFFVTVWLHEPHGPIESDPKFMDLYKDLDDTTLRQYYGNITQLDAAVGQIVQALDAAGIADNTMIWFTSDNGPEGKDEFGDPSRPDTQPGKQRYRGSTGGLSGRKRDTLEGGIRVPFIIKWPAGFRAYGIKPGTVSDVPVVGSDIFPTVLELAGAALPTDRVLDSQSMVPLFEGEELIRKRPLFWRNSSGTHPYRLALRDGPWKILANTKHTEFALYNLDTDLRETTDLSAKNPERFQCMKKQLLEYDIEVLTEAPDWCWKNGEKKLPAGR
jgi:arylsulfatase A